MKTFVITFMLIVASFIGGSMYGFNQGISNYYRLDSIPVAVIYSKQYNQLNNGQASLVQGFQSLQIDTAIDNYIWYKINGNTLLSNYYLSDHTENIDSYINDLIVFRKSTPSEDVSNLLDGENKTNYLKKQKIRNDFIN